MLRDDPSETRAQGKGPDQIKEHFVECTFERKCFMGNIRPLAASRKRVLDAIQHSETDRVPCDYWGTPEYDQMLKNYFGVDSRVEVLQKLGIDIRYVYASGIIYEDSKGLFGPTPRYTGPGRKSFADGSFEDLWGVIRKFIKVASGNVYRDVIRNPLRDMTTVDEIEHYEKWPRAEDFDYSGLRKACDKFEDSALILGGMPGCATIFIQCWYLRGLDQILMDMILSPKLCHIIIEKITEFQVAYHRRLLDEIGDIVDVLMIADDYGTQTGLMMRQNHFREFFKEPTLQLIDLGKEYDLKIMLHSDGNIRNLIPEFIDMGIDILNPIQQVGPDMDPRDLKMEFGKDLCFHGGIDTQGVLPNISVEEVKKEIKEKVEILSQGGGYIVSPTHMLQMDVPLENVITMYEVLNR
jgi:uroporphyrinogen decarboxylase